MGNRAYTGLSSQAYPSGAGGSAGGELQSSIHSGVLNDGTVDIVGLGVTSVSFLETSYISDGSTNTGTTDIVPILSSNTSGGGLAFGSNVVNGPAWKAFDSNMLTSWVTSNINVSPTAPQWLGYKFPVAKCINKFTVSNRYTNDWSNQAPKDFTFQGSNVVTDGNAATNDSDWDSLGTFTGQTNWNNSTGETRTFTVINGTEYKYYRIRVTAVNGHPACAIANWALIEAVSVGGVAYNIQQPNPATTYSKATPEGDGEKTIVITNKSGATQDLKIYYVA
tara:strand:- start:7 stop:843 length:837 start_codon:yes stop_codon:yes gene_type:complete